MQKVLVVDDSLSVRKVVERALGAREIEVVSAASGSDAIDRLEKDAPDLVVSDVLMPDMDGYQICDWVRSHPRLRRTPVLLISGVVDDAVLERASVAGADDVLRKPFVADDLLARAERLLARARASAEAIDTASDTAAGEPGFPREFKKFLDRFAAIPGVSLAALVDGDGFLIESTGDRPINDELAAAMAACLAESSGGLARELGQGALHGMILEYAGGVVVLQATGASAMLVVVISDPTVLGKVRYYIKRTLPDLARVI
jgi:CheY-like chemotaxis protein/predicted regulator of Ras-like GTPase activity (Roadblock/LC7/MglB family)